MSSRVARAYPSLAFRAAATTTPSVAAANAAVAAVGAATTPYAAASAADADAAAAGADASSYIWEQVREDARQIEAGDDLATARLWSIPHPQWFTELDRQARAIWARAPETWDFWLRWWDGALSGQQLDWDLQKQVALIPYEVWEQGPAAVAEAIRLIEERLDLLQQVSTMKAELASLQAALAQQASAAHRAHNHPPDLIDAPAPIVVQVNTLVAALTEAEAELAKPAPEPGALRRIGALIVDATVTALRYCGGLVDTMLQKAAEEAGTTGAKVLIGLGGLSFASQIEAVKELGKALLAFAARLTGV